MAACHPPPRARSKGSVSAVEDKRIKPGTRLVRDWSDASHHVVVLEQGFLYQERRYTSLWQIAQDISGAILDGRQPPSLTRETLIRATRLPLAWDEQRVMFGFA